MNSKPLSTLLKGMVAGATLATIAMVVTSKATTQKVKKFAQITAENVSTMFKMD